MWRTVNLIAIIITLTITSCGKTSRLVNSSDTISPFTTFRDIPGITAEEIAAVEAVKNQFESFVYGMPRGIEMFTDNYNVIQGFSALFCEWLSDLFGIPFVPSLYDLPELLSLLESGAVDFTGELRASEEHRRAYLMTDAIAQRQYKTVRLEKSFALDQIALVRPPRYVFIEGSPTADNFAMVKESGTYQALFANDYEEAYRILEKGEADAFIGDGDAAEAFDAYGNMHVENFFPYIFDTVSLSTANPILQPIISVVTKALRNGAKPYLTQLYNQGYEGYRKNKLFMQFDEDEKRYIRNTSSVPLAARYFNYPVDFYNTYEDKWEGIIFDVLQEVEKLTGLTFEVVNNKNTELAELFQMVYDGKAHIMSEMLYSERRAEYVIWTKHLFLRDQLALLSKSSYPYVDINEISYKRVGVIASTVRAEMFRTWFPDTINIKEYATDESAMFALEQGEIDLVMASKNRLLSFINLYKHTVFKANFLFDYPYESTFGFPKDQTVLCSIIDKTLPLIDTHTITEQWMSKTYDYKTRLLEAQRPWLVGAISLSLAILGLILVMFFRNRGVGKKLEMQIAKRTSDLKKQSDLMEAINQTATLFLESAAEAYSNVLNQSMEMICQLMDVDRVYLWQNIRKDDGNFYYKQLCKWIEHDSSIDQPLQEFHLDTLPDWKELLARGDLLNGPLDSLSRESREFFATFQVQSILAVPLFIRGEFWGFVSLDDCRRKRVFPMGEAYVLRSWGLLVVGAIQRNMITLDMRNTLTKLEAVIKNYKGIIWSVDKTGVMTTFRGQYLKTIGMEPSFVEGKNIEAARKKNRHLDIIEYVNKTLNEGSQDWISDIDGGMFHSYTTPMYDSNNNIIGVVGSTDNVTEIIKLQRDLEKALVNAEIASQTKSQFLANMSHEIRTPMNAILGITEIILRNETLPLDVTEALCKIYNSGDLLLYIINDILDLSKIEAGKLELLPAKYESASMINDTVTLNVMRIGTKPIEFSLSVDENIPAQLFGDELRIRQILNNLLSNAIKYTSKGEVKLTIFAEKGSEGTPSTEGAVTLVFSVSDTGQGMKQEQVSKLFDEYSRFNADANRTTEGTGLGMSITYNLVKLMKGKISVESEPDKGTLVTVRLPQGEFGSGIIGKELAENLTKFEKSTSNQIKKAQILFEPMPYGNVLLVDDVESNLFVAEGLMFPYGLSIDTVSSGFDAINKIKEGKIYDIVFMDHMMPKMDGIETTKKIRKLGYTQPIVALTANAIIGQSNIFMDNGFDGFISKPIDIRQLNAVLKKFIRDKQPPEVIESANRNKDNEGNRSGKVYSRSQLDGIFVRDASRLAKGLEEILESNAYSDEEFRTYTINTHALKSALTNVGETGLSAIAARLEQAGREKNTAMMTADTQAFLDDLWAVIEKHTPRQEDSGAEETANLRFVVEDTAYLREKLRVIKNACEVYDRKTIKKAITELRQKQWQAQTRELLATMEENLLNGDFDALSKLT